MAVTEDIDLVDSLNEVFGEENVHVITSEGDLPATETPADATEEVPSTPSVIDEEKPVTDEK